MRLVVAGNLLVDDIVFESGATRIGQAGGAVIYGALGAALWSADVAIVSRAGDDYPPDVLAALRARGIDLRGVSRIGPRSLRAWLLYEPDGRRLVHRRGGPTHAQATPDASDLQPLLPSTRGVLVSPAPLASQAVIVDALRAHDDIVVAVDPHDHVTGASLDAWRAVLDRVDILFVSEHEIALQELGPDVRSALRRLGGGRLREVLLKRGEAGGLLFEVDADRITPWAAPPVNVVDPTGAGDAFAGGYLTGRLNGVAPVEALTRGAVSASFALEGWGPDGLLGATAADADARLQRLRS